MVSLLKSRVLGIPVGAADERSLRAGPHQVAAEIMLPVERRTRRIRRGKRHVEAVELLRRARRNIPVAWIRKAIGFAPPRTQHAPSDAYLESRRQRHGNVELRSDVGR